MLQGFLVTVQASLARKHQARKGWSQNPMLDAQAQNTKKMAMYCPGYSPASWDPWMSRSRLHFIQGAIWFLISPQSSGSVSKSPTARSGPVDSQHASRARDLMRTRGRRGLCMELLGCEQSISEMQTKTRPLVWLAGIKSAV